MIHSAAVVLDSADALFLAPNEGGKTTIVRHALPGMTPCDDQNIKARVPTCPELSGYRPSTSYTMCTAERPATGCAFQRIL